MVIYFAANLYSTIDNVYIGLSRLDIKLYIYMYNIYKVSACRYSIYVLFWLHTYIVSANINKQIYIYICIHILYIYTYLLKYEYYDAKVPKNAAWFASLSHGILLLP